MLLFLLYIFLTLIAPLTPDDFGTLRAVLMRDRHNLCNAIARSSCLHVRGARLHPICNRAWPSAASCTPCMNNCHGRTWGRGTTDAYRPAIKIDDPPRAAYRSCPNTQDLRTLSVHPLPRKQHRPPSRTLPRLARVGGIGREAFLSMRSDSSTSWEQGAQQLIIRSDLLAKFGILRKIRRLVGV